MQQRLYRRLELLGRGIADWLLAWFRTAAKYPGQHPSEYKRSQYLQLLLINEIHQCIGEEKPTYKDKFSPDCNCATKSSHTDGITEFKSELEQIMSGGCGVGGGDLAFVQIQMIF